jgi:CRP-like cAMP-binding protein/FtsZ-binding cell division protein ZapB
MDSAEGHIIRKMIPFSTMPNHIFKVICGKIIIEHARSGAFLFKRGDTNNDLIYLLKGEISLEAAPLKIAVIKEGSESARFAIAHQFPRKVDAVAKGAVNFLRLNTIFIESPDAVALEKKEHDAIQMAKSADNIDCFATLLMIPIIRSLPPVNLRKISQELEEIRIEKNQIIIQQGAFADYYYLIKQGECLLTHKNSEHAQAIKVAKLQTWDTFGDGELISDEPRAETITALSDMILLSLPKEKFLTLIKKPSLTFIDFIALTQWQAKGAILLDVSPPDDYEKFHLPKAINAPLFTLRMQLKSLDKNQLHIIICKDGRISESAAFLMKTYCFSVKIIKGGFKYAPKSVLLNAQQSLNKAKVSAISVNAPHSNYEKSIRTIRENPEILANENKKLRLALTDIKAKYTNIEHEKNQWEAKYRALLQQMEHFQAKH